MAKWARAGCQVSLPEAVEKVCIEVSSSSIPEGSPSRGGDVVVYVKDTNQPVGSVVWCNARFSHEVVPARTNRSVVQLYVGFHRGGT